MNDVAVGAETPGRGDLTARVHELMPRLAEDVTAVPSVSASGYPVGRMANGGAR